MPEGKLFELILDNIYDAVCVVTSDESGRKRISYWNKAAERLLGFAQEEVLGKPCEASILNYVDEGGKSLCDRACPFTSAADEVEIRRAYVLHRDGFRKAVSLRFFCVDEGGKRSVVEIIRDVLPAPLVDEMYSHLERLAMYDPVTEVANRRYVEQELHARLAETKRHGRQFGVLCIRIDDFGSILKAYGEDFAHRVLKVVAMTMRNSVRAFDTVARCDGDLFLVVVLDVGEKELKIVADRLRNLVLRSSITIGERTLKVTISCGGTLARKSDNVASLFARACEILERARKKGQNSILILPEPKAEEGDIPWQIDL